MPAKKEEKVVTELKKLLESKKLVVGADRVLKLARAGKLSKIFISSNCPQSAKESLAHYSKIAGTAVVELAYSNSQLGTLCKKPFAISVLGVA